MFTGIVEETGEVVSFSEEKEAYRLVVRAKDVLDGLKIGDSVACNGCCLTVVEIGADTLRFDLLGQTVRLTSFADLAPGSLINLERSLAANGRLGGHFVQGHIDETGTITVLEERGKDIYIRVKIPAGTGKYLAPKGSIAIDGISLTVAELHEDGFAVWIIPHTIEVTNLRQKKAGDRVNLEFDMLAKYLERLLQKDA
ncbi:riboflavin synthase [Ruficoccus amylovorans]|uniref:Riboflavin synthase n=1 Tax=Ruficoccus amylovorans TaxID=1804625 RepID=A0A842HBM3_9BACT|nr:riboflavin synthase [Ruficoccus amylovorans]MBC2593559.1 riboflavin synthase [Ruficoccus amylovorans]